MTHAGDGGVAQAPSAERVARNDAAFREANERIAQAGRDLEIEPIPFLCECADEECTSVVRLSLDEYAEIRSDPTHFLNLPGHDDAGGPHAQVIEERDGYVVVEKVGLAARIVTELDER
jgi:hypothetical protein